MSKIDSDLLIDHGIIGKVLRKHGPDFDVCEVLSVNDYRSKTTFQSSRTNSITHMQRTTSVLLTGQSRGNILRHSWVSSGWKSPLEMIKSPKNLRLKNRSEPALFKLNENRKLPLFSGKSQFYGFEKKMRALFEHTFAHVSQAIRGYEISLNFFLQFDRAILESTSGNRGSYEHPYTRLEYSVFSPKEDRFIAGMLMDFSDPEALVSSIQSNLELPISMLVNKVSYLKKGQTPALLSPKVVEILAKVMFEQTKVTAKWPDTYKFVIPKNITLEDDPTSGFGQNSVVFDHEGTPTRKKTLLHQGERAEKTSDLQTSAAYSSESSGNGFRRGLFVSHIADLTPVIQPTYMRMSSGIKSIESLVKDCPEFVFIDTLTFPVDRFHQLVNGQVMMTMEGSYIKNGKVISKVITRNYDDRPLISAHPKSHGSLLDPTAQILSNGAYTYSGWYPYIFLPTMTWSANA